MDFIFFFFMCLIALLYLFHTHEQNTLVLENTLIPWKTKYSV